MAAFTSKSWKTTPKIANIEDPSARVFALTINFKVFEPKNPAEAVGNFNDYGPKFMSALEVEFKNKGSC